MDIHVQQGKPRTITGEFMCSQHEPVSDKTTSAARGKKVSRLPSRCELDCDHAKLSIYLLSSCSAKKNPLLLTLSNICKVTRSKHDKEYFCLEYGTEKDPFYIFLTILTTSDADDWEYELCKITGQTPPRRRRLRTGVPPKRLNQGYTLSTPGAPQGFSLGAKRENSNKDKEPVEGHIGEVLGYENISPTPENSSSSPHSDHGDEDPDEPCSTIKVLEGVSQKLLQQQQQQQHHQQQHQQLQIDPEDKRPSVIQPLVSNEPTPSEISVPQSLHEDQPVVEPCPQEEAYCTHMETECSQVKVIVAVDKEELLRTDKFNDIFVRYQRSIYVKSCPERLQHKLSIGTRILLVNNEEPSNPAAIHRLISEAQNPVNLLVQLFPLGVRVQLRVPSFTDLGIELYGNEITSMRRDGVLSRITDGLRCMSPALPTPDAPHAMYVEQRSITAIGDRHVPFDATTEEVERMLNAAINNGNGLVVLQLHPTDFCHAIAPDALQRRLQKGGVLNPRPSRRPSLARIFNPPLSPT